MALNQVSGNSLEGAPPASVENKKVPADGTGVLELDPWLEPYKEHLKSRYAKANEWIQKLNDTEGGLDKFSRVSELPWDPHAEMFCIWRACYANACVNRRATKTLVST